MHIDMLAILRCPYCGGRLDVIGSPVSEYNGDEIRQALVACYCCVFPVVGGIPVLHLHPEAQAARDALERGMPDRALRALLRLKDEGSATAFETVMRSPTATYREAVAVAGPEFEGDYLLYRFADPSFVVTQAVVGALAGRVLADGGRVLDLCGGSGHLTWQLLTHAPPAPVLADQSFTQTWLARRFVAPGCEAVCCDANAPLPFARGAFALVVCADAFQYIWTKRQAAGEMARLVEGVPRGTVVISHAHNQRQWSPSHGQPLPPSGYRDLFETLEARVFSDARLRAEAIGGGPVDLSRADSREALEADPELTIVASRSAEVFASYPIAAAEHVRGTLRVNPLYAVEEKGDELRLSLCFPSAFYAEEYGGCRQYLPETLTLTRKTLAALQTRHPTGLVAELVRRRIVLDVPGSYL